MKNLRLRLLSIRQKATYKHLPGMHNQLDHAWNRGMGGENISVAQYRAMVKMLDEQVAAGEITQQVANLTRKNILKKANLYYDEQVRQGLLKPRTRRQRAMKPPITSSRNIRENANTAWNRDSADSIAMNAQAVALSNRNMQASTDFPRFWNEFLNGTKTSQEQIDLINQQYEGKSIWNNTPNGYQTTKLIRDFIYGSLNEASYVPDFPSSGLQYFVSETDRKIYSEKNDIIKNISWKVGDLGKQTDSPSETLKSINELLQKQLDIMNDIKSQKIDFKSDEFDKYYTDSFWESDLSDVDIDKANFVRKARSQNIDKDKIQDICDREISRLQILMQVTKPEFLNAMYDMYSTAKQNDIFTQLESNTTVDLSPVFGTIGATNFYTDQRNAPTFTPAMISALIIQNLGDARAYVSENILQQLLQTISKDEAVAGQFKKRWGTTELNTDTFFREFLTKDMSIDDLALASAQLATQLEKKFTDVDRTRATQEEKDKQKQSLYESYVRNIFSSLSRKEVQDLSLHGLELIPNAFVIKKLLSDSEQSYKFQYDTLRKYAEIYNLGPVADGAITGLTNLYAKSLSKDSQVTDLHKIDSQIEKLKQEIEIANKEGRTSNADRFAREIDNLTWEYVKRTSPEQFVGLDDEDILKKRLQMQTDFLSSKTIDVIRDELDQLQESRDRDIESKYDDIIDSLANVQSGYEDQIADYVLPNYVDAYIANERRNGTPDKNIQDRLMTQISDLNSQFPFLNLSSTTMRIKHTFPNVDINFNNFDYSSYESIQNEVWGDVKPVLIGETDRYSNTDELFTSSVFPDNGIINNPMWDNELVGPDNPKDVPLFNPRAARFGARTTIDEKKTNPKNLLDSRTEIALRDELDKYGYSSDLLDQIVDSLTDAMLPTTREDVRINVGFSNFDKMLTIHYERGLYVDPEVYTKGVISIEFGDDPQDTVIEHHVDYMKVPNDPNNKYRGSSAPFITFSMDQMRELAYALGTKNTKITADAVDIRNQKEKGGSSGPSTWPVLGFHTPINVSGKLKLKLLEMGYTSEFVQYIQQSSVIPSYMLFLNAPPNIMIHNPDTGGSRKIKTTQQNLWTELYDSGAVGDRFDNIELNFSNPNDPFRIYSPFLPRKKEKEWVSIYRLKNIIQSMKSRYKIIHQ